LERGGWFADLRKKRRALDRLLPTIRATADPITRDLYLTRASEASGVSKETLQQEVDRPERGVRPSQGSPPQPRGGNGTGAARDRAQRSPGITPGVAAEEELIRVMLHDREQMDFLVERVGPDDFLNPECKELFVALVERGHQGTNEDVALAVSQLAVRKMEALLATPAPGAGAETSRVVDDALRALECRRIYLRSREIDSLRQQGKGDADALFIEKKQLALRSKELGCKRQFWK
jgi:DNA primase